MAPPRSPISKTPRTTLQRRCSAALAVALVFGAAACSKHDDASSNATEAPTSTEATAAAELPASPSASASGLPVPSPNATSGDVSQLVRDGFPMYPNATLENGQLFDVTANGTHTMAASLTTNDDFDAVDSWYKSHVSSQYSPTHINVGDVEESSYTLGTDTSLPHYAAVVARVKAGSGTTSSTRIVITIKETAR